MVELSGWHKEQISENLAYATSENSVLAKFAEILF